MGKEQEAIALLNWGIATLADKNGKHYMHKSVIIYNICQCYKKLGQYDRAIEKYRELLTIDYAFAEYHVEMGLCMQLKGDLTGFKASIEDALAVNAYHSDSHYHYSLIKLNENDLACAEHHAKLAWELTGDDITAYNYAYIQSLIGKYNLLNVLQPTYNSQLMAEWSVLKAEKVCQKSPSQALSFLTETLTLCPKNELIIANIEYIKTSSQYA